MNRIEIDKSVKVVTQVREQSNKFLQMIFYGLLLMGILAQETFLHNELYIRFLNLQVGIAIGYVAKHIGSKLEFWRLVY